MRSLLLYAFQLSRKLKDTASLLGSYGFARWWCTSFPSICTSSDSKHSFVTVSPNAPVINVIMLNQHCISPKQCLIDATENSVWFNDRLFFYFVYLLLKCLVDAKEKRERVWRVYSLKEDDKAIFFNLFPLVYPITTVGIPFSLLS